jgi:hypothetical protein
MPSEAGRDATLAQTEGHVYIDTVAWVTRFVGGNGSDRIGFELVIEPEDTVRTVLRRLSERFPQLQYALWDPESGELGEHIEVVVNSAILAGTFRPLAEKPTPARPGGGEELSPRVASSRVALQALAMIRVMLCPERVCRRITSQRWPPST